MAPPFPLSRTKRLLFVIIACTIYFFVEIAIGLKTGSLALIVDAFHQLNDLISYVVALMATRLALSTKHRPGFTFALKRCEIVGAFFNASILLALAISIFLQSIERFIDVPEVEDPKLVLIVGGVGLVLNAACLCICHEHGHGHAHNHGHGADRHPHSRDHDRELKQSHAHVHGDYAGSSVTSEREDYFYPNLEDEIRNIRIPSLYTQIARPVTLFFSDHHHEIHHPNVPHSTTHQRGTLFSRIRKSFVQLDEERVPDLHETSRAEASPRSKHRSLDPGSPRHAAPGSERWYADNGDHQHSISMRFDAGQNMLGAIPTPPKAIPREVRRHVSRKAVPELGDIGDVHHHRSTGLNDSMDGTPLRQGHRHDHQHHDLHDQHHDHADTRTAIHDHTHSHGQGASYNLSHSHGNGHGHSFGLAGVIVHLIGDAINNIGVIIAALIMWLTTSPARFYADPAVSVAIGLIIFAGSLPLTLQSARILLEAAPKGLDLEIIHRELLSIPGIASIHCLHVWQLTESDLIGSLHVQSHARDLVVWSLIEKQIRRHLEEKGVNHVTISPEFVQASRSTSTLTAGEEKQIACSALTSPVELDK